MKQSGTPQLVYPVGKTALLFGQQTQKGEPKRQFVYRAVKRGELQLVKLGIRSSAITRESIARMAEKRGIPLPDGF